MFSFRTYLIAFNILLLGVLFSTISMFYWIEITKIRDAQLAMTVESLRTSMEARGSAVNKSMSLGIQQAVVGFDFSTVNILLSQAVEHDKELRQCLLMDSNGVIFSHNDQSNIGSQLSDSIVRETKRLLTSQSNIGNNQNIVEKIITNQEIHFISPIYNGNSVWGALRCTYSTASLEENISATKTQWQENLDTLRASFISMASVFFLVAVILVLLFNQKIIQAIKKLAEGVNRISQGDLAYNIDQKGLLINELKNFAKSFNQMSRNLLSSKQELDEYNKSLEEKVEQRTRELEAANKELEAFSYSVSHDLRAPLRTVNGLGSALLEDYADKLDDDGKMYLNRIMQASIKMDELIKGLLTLSRAGRSELTITDVDVNKIINEVVSYLLEQNPGVPNKVIVQSNLTTKGDPNLISIVLENLISNAWKYSSKKELIKIEIGSLTDNPQVFYIKDNGAGFNMKYVDKLFSPFQRLHKVEDFEGIGIGLATVARIINRHNGKIWVESKLNEGTTFYFSFCPVN